ncbi:hypothetical protein CcaverHIS631_0302400 [Cutaneotrichosporon cavernicola]|nr:hypothetical protein CcaverHIS631_0302400 [Cutaneotrichosporon cavernicola]
MGIYRAIRLAIKVSGPDRLHAHSGPGQALTLCGFVSLHRTGVTLTQLFLLVAMCFTPSALCAPQARHKNEYSMTAQPTYVAVGPQPGYQ